MLKNTLYLLASLFLWNSCNPFAPKYNENGLNDLNSLGNPISITGYFKLFKNSYELRDTSMYGRLFAPNFTFEYYDFDKGQNFSWDRTTEMGISYRLFQSVQQINLDWNFFVQLDTTDTTAFMVRNFNLSITENESVSYSGTGRARMRLTRHFIGDPWKCEYWFDDSDF